MKLLRRTAEAAGELDYREVPAFKRGREKVTELEQRLGTLTASRKAARARRDEALGELENAELLILIEQVTPDQVAACREQYDQAEQTWKRLEAEYRVTERDLDRLKPKLRELEQGARVAVQQELARQLRAVIETLGPAMQAAHELQEEAKRIYGLAAEQFGVRNDRTAGGIPLLWLPELVFNPNAQGGGRYPTYMASLTRYLEEG